MRGASSYAGWRIALPGYNNKRQRMSAEDMDELTESIRRQVIENIVARIPNILAAQGFTIVPHGLSPNSPSDARRTSFSTIEGGGSTLKFAGHEEMPHLQERHLPPGQPSEQRQVPAIHHAAPQQMEVTPQVEPGSISLLTEPALY